MAKITEKVVQVHTECVCGYNEVDSLSLLGLRWKDLSKNGIIRKKDKKTGKYFLFTQINFQVCHCEEFL